MPGQYYYTIIPTTLPPAVLNITKRHHPHPAVKYIDHGKSTIISARFRSLSSRTIDLWDGNYRKKTSTHLLMKIFEAGAETTFTVEGSFKYFYTTHEKKVKYINSSTVYENQVTNSLNRIRKRHLAQIIRTINRPSTSCMIPSPLLPKHCWMSPQLKPVSKRSI